MVFKVEKWKMPKKQKTFKSEDEASEYIDKQTKNSKAPRGITRIKTKNIKS